MKTTSREKAVVLALGNLDWAVVTCYHLALLLSRLYRPKKYSFSEGEKFPDKNKLSETVNALLDLGVLQQLSSVPETYSLIGRKKLPAEEIICTVDPFAYISHLSAMAYHGLTSRMPKTIFISSPPPPKWKEFALQRMKKDLGEAFEEYFKNGLPLLKKISFDKIGRQKISCYASIHLGTFKHIKDENLRVSTIGRTFLEMLQRPDLCGGIYHVMEVFEESAEQYLNLIVNELDAHGKQIDKVRAGYILEEICGLRHEVINERWIKAVKRGGSRKLDPAGDYSSEYSERWGLSLNL